MLCSKSINTLKLIFGLILAFIAITLILLSRNSVLPRQASYDVFRYLAGQETNIKTLNFNEFETDNFKIRYLTDDEDFVPMIAHVAEKSFSVVSDFFKYEPKNQTVLVVYPDTQSLAASFGWDKDEKAMGVYWGGTIRILSPREWLGSTDNKDKFYTKGPIVHEFTHLIVDEITRGNYTRWWTEAVAQYVEKKLTGFEFKNPFANNKQIQLYELSTLEKNFDSLDQQIAYWQSLKIIEYIVYNYGEESIFHILESLGKGNNMTQAIEETLEMNIGKFEEKYQQYIQKN